MPRACPVEFHVYRRNQPNNPRVEPVGFIFASCEPLPERATSAKLCFRRSQDPGHHLSPR